MGGVQRALCGRYLGSGLWMVIRVLLLFVHSPLTPEPVSPEYRGEGRYGFEERMGGLAVFCIESWCSVYVWKCREVCAGFQVVKIDHPPRMVFGM